MEYDRKINSARNKYAEFKNTKIHMKTKGEKTKKEGTNNCKYQKINKSKIEE